MTTRGRKPKSGRITFVGSGPGDPGLLTTRARGVLANAALVFTDPDVPGAVLALAGSNSRRRRRAPSRQNPRPSTPMPRPRCSKADGCTCSRSTTASSRPDSCSASGRRRPRRRRPGEPASPLCHRSSTPSAWRARSSDRNLDHGLRRRLDRAAGARWAALPHAFSFVDPLFSTGIAWSLIAVERLAGLLLETPDAARLSAGLARYERLLIREHEQILALVRGAERRFGDFDRFVEWAKLYFVAASWCEARQRLVGIHPTPAGRASSASATRCSTGCSPAPKRRRRAGSRSATPGYWRPPRSAIWGGFTRADIGRRIGVDLDTLVERSSCLGLTAEAARAALPRLRGLGKSTARP